MPKGPNGQKRPADVIGAAIMVAKIATGEIEELSAKDTQKNVKGSEGGKARAATMTSEKRKEIAKLAAEKRWKK